MAKIGTKVERQVKMGASEIDYKVTVGGLPAVTFLRNGSASEEGGFYLATARAVAAGEKVNVRMVMVDRATGRPSWFIYDASGWKREF